MNTINFENKLLTPSKIICIGRNYVEHIQELNNEAPSEPVIFMKPNSAISEKLFAGKIENHHFEGEICFLIQHNSLAGVGVGLDITKRKLQSALKEKGLPWERAKAFDGSAVFSQFITLSSPLTNLRMELFLNRKLTQEATYPLMIYKPDALLEEIQQFISLEDGDILMTGTPKGVGEFLVGDQFEIKLYTENTLLLKHSWHVS